MTQQLAPERPAPASTGPSLANPTGLVAAAAAVRGAGVAVAGLILAAGLATLVWAMTPSSGPDVVAALRGGVVGFAAANLMPVDIGGVTLSLPPLMFTLVIAALLASAARRGRFLPDGRYQEAVSVLVTALVYGVIVAATTRGFGPLGAVAAQWVWTAPAIALVATGGAMLQPGSSWHEWCVARIPAWLRAGIRGGGVGLGVLLAGGGLAVTVGLISHFGDAVSVATLAAPSWMDGLGLSMLGLAYLPNAVIAGAGYVTGVGFEIGAGTYSPFSTVPIDLPAVPLLAAVPDAAGRSWIGLIFLAVPVAAGYLVARVAITRLPTREDRALAAGLGALLTGGLLAAVVAIASGGVGEGRWSRFGSPPLLVAAAVIVEVGVISIALAALTQAHTVPWRVGGSTTGSRVKRSARIAEVEPVDGVETVVTDTGTSKRRGSKRPTQESARERSSRRTRRSAQKGLSTGPGSVAQAVVPPPASPVATTAMPSAGDGATDEPSPDLKSTFVAAGNGEADVVGAPPDNNFPSDGTVEGAGGIGAVQAREAAADLSDPADFSADEGLTAGSPVVGDPGRDQGGSPTTKPSPAADAGVSEPG